MSFQDFQKAPNRLKLREVGNLLLLIVVVTLVLTALGAANYYLTGILPGGGEFHLLRIAGRSFLFDRIEPYTGYVPARVQEQVYDRAALPEENAYILDIPFHVMILFFPLALFPDVLMARAFWMTLTEIALFAMIFFSYRLLRRSVPNVFRIIIFSLCFVSLYAYLAFLEGSLTILLGLALLAIIFSLRAGTDEITGILIVLSSFLWEIAGPFLLFVILWVIWEKRWRVFFGAVMLIFIFSVISYFIYPGWVLPFWRAAWNSLRLGFGFSAREIFISLWPAYGRIFSWILAAVLMVSLGYEWRAAKDVKSQRFAWAVSLTLAVTPLLGHRLQLDHLVLLSMPLMLLIVVARERWGKLGNVIAVMLLLFFFGIPWLLYFQGVSPITSMSDKELLFLIWPLFTTTGLYWMRWWILRPPRTWIENITQMET